MRTSQLLSPTLREVPAEAEVISHQLMLRAGMIRKSAAGIYTYLPLGYRVIKKIMEIVRQEMDRAGSQELMLPIVQPAELWHESGRWAVYGDELIRFKDRHKRDFCLGPTHEEIITDLVRGEVRSYKELPLLLYQIQNKYRDERRPRFGLMRGREFIMKDLYSFDRDEEGLAISYEKMYEAYTRVFKRCGLVCRPVEADAGAIGGKGGTHEFMVLAEAGEAAVVYCNYCDYAANVEKAEGIIESPEGEEQQPLTLVDTPGAKTIEEVASYLNLPARKLIKTLFYQADDRVVAVLVRGDREVNEIKVKNLLDCLNLELLNEAEVERITGAPAGYVGPVGLQGVEIYGDHEVALMVNGVVGANRTDAHYLNAVPGRDFVISRVADLRMVNAGEPCPRCKEPLAAACGIEVGQIFKLGTKYSEALGAKYLDENGRERTMVMGCYGIGVSRTMAAAIEQNHDQDGIIWPLSIAPYHVIVVPINVKDIIQKEVAEKIYQELLECGVEAVLDDRDERPGVKFKDADLIGYPLRITIGPKTLEQDKVEVRYRSTGKMELIEISQARDFISNIVKQGIRDLEGN